MREVEYIMRLQSTFKKRVTKCGIWLPKACRGKVFSFCKKWIQACVELMRLFESKEYLTISAFQVRLKLFPRYLHFSFAKVS